MFDFDLAESRALKETAIAFEAPNTFISDYKSINQALWQALEKGQITTEALKILRFSKVIDALNMPIDADIMSAYYIERLGEGADLLPFARELCEILSQNVRLAVITNGIFDIQMRRINKSGLGKCFEQIFVSETLGYSKPDPKIFDEALKQLGYLDRNKVLMIGDSIKADIQGAQSAGIDTCWVNLKGHFFEGNKQPTYEVNKLEDILKCF